MDHSPERDLRTGKRRTRWWAVLGIGCGVVLAIVLAFSAAVYFERARVATLFVQRYLASYGIQSDVEFSRFGWGGFLARVRAGPTAAPDFTAESMEVTLVYPNSGVIGSVTPQLASVRLIHPYLRATYDGEKMTFGSLQSLIDESLAADSKAPKPSVAIENGNLSLATPNGTLGLIADVTIEKGELRHLKAAVQPGSFKAGSVTADIAAGTVSVDLASGAWNAFAAIKANAIAFPGGSARGTELSSEIRGLEWKSDGGSYSFTLVRAVATLNAAATESPAFAASGSTTSLTLDAIEGNFAGGRLKASARGVANSELTGLHAGEASFDALKAQSTFSSLMIDGSPDAWSATGEVRTVLLGSGARYPVADGSVLLTSFNADAVSSGTLKSDGANGSLRGTLSANGTLPRAVSLRSFKLDFDGSGALAKDEVSGSLQASLSANGNVPRAVALDLAHRIPGIGADEGIASSIAGALQGGTLTMRDVGIARSGEAMTVSSRGALTLDGASGARVVISPRGGGPLIDMRGGESAGRFGVDIRGGGLPEFRLAVSSYRYRKDGDRTAADADAQFETVLDFGSLRGLRAAGAGKLQVRGDKIGFASADCADLSLAAYRSGSDDRIRNAKGRLCGSSFQLAGDRLELDLPGCADVSFDSFLNNGTAMVSDAKGKFCGTAGQPMLISEPAGWRFQGHWTETSARAIQAQSAIGDASGRIELSGKGAEIKSGSVDVAAAGLSDLTREPRFRPLSASGGMRATGPDWKGEFTLASSNRRLASVAVRHSLETAGGEAMIDAQGLAFEPNGLQPANLAPFLATFGTRVRGRADFTGRVAWSKDGLRSDGRLVLSDVDFQSRAGMVRQTKADLAFSSLIPIALRANQTITMSRVELFLPLESVSARFTYTPEAFRLEAASAAVAEGEVALDPLNYSFAPGATTAGTLRLKNVNIAPLIAAAGLSNRVSAAAHIDGAVPFTLGPEGVRFANGHVAANGPGRLSIKRDALTTSVGVGQGAQAPPNAVQDFAYQALENLAFDQLDGTVNSKPMGRLGLLLHVKGQNDPAQVAETRVGVIELVRGRAFDKPLPLPKGTPIDLTLDTSLNLDELLNSYFNRAGNGAAMEDAGK